MLIDNIHTFLKFLKNQGESKDFSPEEIDEAIHRASVDLFSLYRPKHGLDSVANSALRPFEKIVDITITNGDGSLPSDYAQESNVETVVDSKLYRAEIVPVQDWIERKNDPIAIPEDKDAIVLMHMGGVTVEPSTVVKVRLYYLSHPVRPEWAYTASLDGRDVVFDEGNSTDLEWDEGFHNHILVGALTYLGVPLRDSLLIQFKQLQESGSQIRSRI